jgi:ATP-dependent helicase/nuclease subunit A
VHGAKGLEAPVVVLADTTTEPAGPNQYQPRLFSIPPPSAPPGTPPCVAWVRKKSDDTAVSAKVRADAITASENEYRRLLYVAMTRAADRLVVCGSIGEKKAPPGCWYELIEQGLSASGLLVEEAGDVPDIPVRRYRKFAPEVAPAQPRRPQELGLALRPPWLSQNVAEAACIAPIPITPSGFIDDPAKAGLAGARDARRRALARGNIVHRLMQSLPDVPEAARAEAARRHIERQRTGQPTDLTASEADEIVRQVLAVIADTRFAALFAPGSRAEVPIVGQFNGRKVAGVVDRLAVAPDAVLIADYKTNRLVPADLAETRAQYQGYIKQLSHYREVLARLYPDRPVRAALVWTAHPRLAEIPAKALDAALAGDTGP